MSHGGPENVEGQERQARECLPKRQ